MNLRNIDSVYLIGIGGIGMSALARYFHIQGKTVAGYDRMPSDLTHELSAEGMDIHYEDSVALIPVPFKNSWLKNKILIIYTPAVPTESNELNYFIRQKFEVYKRAQVLGEITRQTKTIAISGTHGKTTTSTCVAHLLNSVELKCNAFLGGISNNLGTNLLLNAQSEIVVVEADEFDRSFLTLFPFIAVVTSVDADHLDIYGSKDEVEKAFAAFIMQIKPGGKLLIKKNLKFCYCLPSGVDQFTYALDQVADFYAENISIINGLYHFDLVTPKGVFLNVNLGLPGLFNVENAIAAMGAAILAGADIQGVLDALTSFRGVKRRFDVRIVNAKHVYIDDYAHHPEELKACIRSVRALYKDHHITGVFQPHLYSRTRDFYVEFAQSLSELDRLVLLDIYPAREIPIEGVTSNLIFDLVTCDKVLCSKEHLIQTLKKLKTEVVITMGAGDIDRKVPELEKLLGE